MAKFNPGDPVMVNNALAATILVYDEDLDQLVYESPLPGGATNVTYGHVTNTKLEAIAETGRHEAPEGDPELPLEIEGE